MDNVVEEGQYNPEEWEECKEKPFLWWWRMLATLSTIVLAILFYYYIEKNKRSSSKKVKSSKSEDDDVRRVLRKDEYKTYGSSNDEDSTLRRRTKETQWATFNTDVDQIQNKTFNDNFAKFTQTGTDDWANNQETNVESNHLQQFNKSPETSADNYEITNVLTTVEVTLKQRQKNLTNGTADDTAENVTVTDSSDDRAVASRRSQDTNATSPDVDSSSTRTDEWSEKITRTGYLHQLLVHDHSDGLVREEIQEMKKSPGRPAFVSDLVVKSNDDKQNDKNDEEATTNSILEIAKVETTEELLMKVTTLEAITEIMRRAGLESSNLIFGNNYSNYYCTVRLKRYCNSAFII